jgi:hypothetical protein
MLHIYELIPIFDQYKIVHTSDEATITDQNIFITSKCHSETISFSLEVTIHLVYPCQRLILTIHFEKES